MLSELLHVHPIFKAVYTLSCWEDAKGSFSTATQATILTFRIENQRYHWKALLVSCSDPEAKIVNRSGRPPNCNGVYGRT
jgi:hypothetical protein